MSKTIQPKILKEYSVIRELGSGAYGHVWEVKCKKTEKKYALKKIFDAFRNKVDAQRTYRQLQFLSKIQNPFIIKLQRILTSKNKKDTFAIFQFMQADLQIALHLNILQKNHLIYIFYQILLGLDYLHQRNLIHRDMKPSNVLIDNDSKIKLCDFGLIRSGKDNKIQQIVLTDEVGTKWYRAPEILLGSKQYSNKVDIWSFGCIVVELLTKKVAFSGTTTLGQLELMLQFNGSLSAEDKQSLKLQTIQNIQKINSSIVQKSFESYFCKVDKQFYPLIKNTLQINPNKRWSARQLLKLSIFDQFRQKQLQKRFQQVQEPFIFQLDDERLFEISQYRQKVQEFSKKFNQKKVQKALISDKQLTIFNQQNIKLMNQSQKQKIKRNSKSLNQEIKQPKRNINFLKNHSGEKILNKKFIQIPKINNLEMKGEQSMNNIKMPQLPKSGSFTIFSKKQTQKNLIPYIRHQKLIKKPIQNIMAPFKSIQNKVTQTLIKKSYHNSFSNIKKILLKEQQNQTQTFNWNSIHRANVLDSSKNQQKRQLYIYSNWITQTIYGKQNRHKN